MQGKKTILAVGAHMDDVWYGVGGLALIAAKKGHRVVFINTVGDYSNWPVTQGREAELKPKVRAFAEDRGIEIRFLNYKYEHVPDTPECMAELARHCDEIAPDILFCHWFEDTNRDHEMSGRATAYGCTHASCFLSRMAKTPGQAYAFQLDSQCRNFQPRTYFNITETLPDVLEVLKAVDEIYAGYLKRNFLLGRVKDFVTGREFDLTTHNAQKFALAITRGAECGVAYAEAYHPLRPVIAPNVLNI